MDEVVKEIKERLSDKYDEGFVDFYFRDINSFEELKDTNVDVVEEALNNYCWSLVYDEGESLVENGKLKDFVSKVLEAVQLGVNDPEDAMNYALHEIAREEVDVDPEDFLCDLAALIEEAEREMEENNDFSP